MSNLINLWSNNKSDFESKKLSQIIAFTGDGNPENEETAKQLRAYFRVIPSNKIFEYIDECLTDSFKNSGFILQDLVNEIGNRLDFNVSPGRYRGVKGQNGYDGIWEGTDGHTIVIEVKTTDAYRINLDTLINYKDKYINSSSKKITNISILIVVGRKDTGDLEAQIRGSKFAWEIRIISVDSLIKLLQLKESINDRRVIHQIYEVLKPYEYTKIDQLIELIFLTAQDAELNDIMQNDHFDMPDEYESEENNIEEEKHKASQFHKKCIDRIENSKGICLMRKSRNLFGTESNEEGIIVSVSKTHYQGKKQKFWFAYHPYFKDNLAPYKRKFVAYGCGSENDLFLIPLDFIELNKKDMWTTEKKDHKRSIYWHIVIFKGDDGKFFLQIPNSPNSMVDLTDYKI